MTIGKGLEIDQKMIRVGFIGGFNSETSESGDPKTESKLKTREKGKQWRGEATMSLT